MTESDPRAAAFARLLQIVDRLRDPSGCPWDREQSLESLAPSLLEEAYEAADAAARGDRPACAQELGDLLMNIVLAARIAEDAGDFGFAEVANGIADKLVRRHPHVFGEAKAGGVAGVLRNWEQIKSQERAGELDPSVLAGVPAALPALLRAYRMGEKAARVGFRWPSIDGALEKLDEELGELRRALGGSDTGAIEEELGDVLFSVVNVARHAHVEPETALRRAAARFGERFRYLERTLGERLKDAPLAELEQAWRQAKLHLEPGLESLPPGAADEWREVARKLARTRERLLKAVVDLPPDLSSADPPAEVSAWAVDTVLEHLWRAEASIAKGMQRTLAAARAAGPLAPFPPEGLAARPPQNPVRLPAGRVDAPAGVVPKGGIPRRQLCDDLGTSRAALWRVLAEAAPFDPRPLVFPHPILGSMDLLQWLEFVAQHEERHLCQILRIRKAFAER